MNVLCRLILPMSIKMTPSSFNFRLVLYIRTAYLECTAQVRGTCVRPPWRIQLCSAKCFGLLLCVTINGVVDSYLHQY